MLPRRSWQRRAKPMTTALLSPAGEEPASSTYLNDFAILWPPHFSCLRRAAARKYDFGFFFLTWKRDAGKHTVCLQSPASKLIPAPRPQQQPSLHAGRYCTAPTPASEPPKCWNVLSVIKQKTHKRPGCRTKPFTKKKSNQPIINLAFKTIHCRYVSNPAQGA